MEFLSKVICLVLIFILYLKYNFIMFLLEFFLMLGFILFKRSKYLGYIDIIFDFILFLGSVYMRKER